MSQKVVKKARRRTEDELEKEFKTPDSAKAKEEILKSASAEAEAAKEENGMKELSPSDKNSKTEVANGDHGVSPTTTRSRSKTKTPEISKEQRRSRSNTSTPENSAVQTRSRSNTPLIKTPENAQNGTKDKPVEDKPSIANKTEAIINGLEAEAEEEKLVENGAQSEILPLSPLSVISVEMEPLVLEKDDDEPIPELEFDETDVDAESEGSPGRCKTRRSQTRNMSTPKTPKLDVEPKPYTSPEPDTQSGSSTPKKVTSTDSNLGSSESQPDENLDFNDTSDTYSSVSTDNISTRAVAGSDATRNVDFTYQDSGLDEDNSISYSPNRSLAETLRGLSSRRTIRPIGTDYRRFALKNNLDNKGDVYADYESVQRISVGSKRKNRSSSPEDSKRFKKEGAGLMSYFSNSLNSFKGSISKSSTPKLIGYEKRQSGYEEDLGKIRLEVGHSDEEKKWCAIM